MKEAVAKDNMTAAPIRRLVSIEEASKHLVVSGARLYSLHEAATYLGISYWTVRELINRHAMPAVRIGRRVMVDVADLNRFIEANKSQADMI